MAKVSFNGINREIIILPSIEDIDVQIDLYSDWKEWVLLSDNSKYPAAFRTFGGDPTIPGQFAPRYFFLINNWELLASSVSVDVATNLYSDADGSGIVIDNAAVLVRNSDAAVVDTGLEQSLDYNGIVYINTRLSNTGVEYPYGTIAQPVTNLTDAVIIADQYGINTFNIRGDINFDIDMVNCSFESGEYSPTVNFETIDVSNSEFNNFTLTGTISMPDLQNISVDKCIIDNLHGFNGIAHNCALRGDIFVSPEHSIRYVLLIDCVSSISGFGYPTIHFLDAATISNIDNINVRNYSGGIGLSGSNFGTGSVASIELDPGIIHLEPNIINGKITVRGVGSLDNNLIDSNNVELDTTGFFYDIERSTQTNAYNSKIIIDAITGITGSYYPIGTNATPVNNLNDAILIAERYGLHIFDLHTGITISNTDISDYSFTSDSFPPSIMIDNCTASKTTFYQVNISGTFSGPDLLNPTLIENSVVGNLDNFNGIIYNSGLNGELKIPENSNITITDSKSLIPGTASPVISKYNGHTASVSLNMRAYSGGIRIKDWNNPGDITTVEYIAGRANIDITCIDGTIVLRGDGSLNNEMATASNTTLITDGFQSDINDHLERMEPEQFRVGNVVDNIYASMSSDSDTINAISGSVSLILEDTTELVTDVNYLVTRIDIQSDILNKIAGLVQSNYRIFNQIYDVDGLLQSATIRTYPTATDTNNNTNSDYEYSMIASYDGSGRLTDYRVTDV